MENITPDNVPTETGTPVDVPPEWPDAATSPIDWLTSLVPPDIVAEAKKVLTHFESVLDRIEAKVDAIGTQGQTNTEALTGAANAMTQMSDMVRQKGIMGVIGMLKGGN